MYMRDATQAEMYYEVHRDGTLGFGGGIKARLNNTTWTGTLTPDELKEFQRLLAAEDWFKEKPASTHAPEKHLYRVEINAPENRRKFTVKGESERLRPIQQLLAKACLRRLEDDLKILPPPSSQR
jgi:hypothetical protein